jgi:geranylgeranyl pyrophosphate synthase
MDDDDLRRGRPSCHRAYDAASAILVGDALQALGFAVLASDPMEGVSDTVRRPLSARHVRPCTLVRR